MKRRILSIVCALALCLGMLPATAWAANTPVTYMTWNENQKQSVSVICTTYYALTDMTSTTWGTAGEASWYVLDADVTFDERITLQGDVRLILKDGYTLTANGGIGTKDDSSLTIYGQSGDSGKLIASASDGNAGIGSDSGTKASGDITICGGTVEATGGADAAGIGTGREGNIGDITIYGGIIKAVGGTDAAGIGTGLAGVGTYITLAGGTIEAARGEVLEQETSSGVSANTVCYDVGPGWKDTMKAFMTFTAGHEGVGDDGTDDGTDDTETGSSSQGEYWYRYVVDICGGSLCTTAAK